MVRNKAEKKLVTCDGNLKRKIQGRDWGKVAHAALGGRDILRNLNKDMGGKMVGDYGGR